MSYTGIMAMLLLIPPPPLPPLPPPFLLNEAMMLAPFEALLVLTFLTAPEEGFLFETPEVLGPAEGRRAPILEPELLRPPPFFGQRDLPFQLFPPP